ncbi:Binding partner of ACD11 1 [Linum perenne]
MPKANAVQKPQTRNEHDPKAHMKCDFCGKTRHTREMCWKLRGKPSHLKNTRSGDVPRAHTVATGEAGQLSQEQIEHILSLLKPQLSSSTGNPSSSSAPSECELQEKVAEITNPGLQVYTRRKPIQFNNLDLNPLQGATIVDQRVCISAWGTHTIDESDPWNSPSWKVEDRAGYEVHHVNHLASSPGEAVTVAQEVVKTMLAKGYILGKDALVKAKALDESHKVSASAAAKVAELSSRIGLTDSIQSGMETAKFIDEKYHVSDITKTAILYTGAAAVTAATITGRSAAFAAQAVVNSSYFAKGAVWVSDALKRAAHATAEFGHKQSQ